MVFLATTLASGLAEDGKRNQPGSPEGQLQIMDTNKDGKISSDEFYGPDEMFAQLDSDSSGYVTLTELEFWDRKGGRKHNRSRRKRNPQKFLDRMDTNNDGKISKDEFRGRSEMFGKIDTNKDGFLSIDELETMPPLRGDKGSGRRRGGRGFSRGNF